MTTSLLEQANSAVPAGLTALTKGGLAAVTKSLAIEYARSGIRVNAISPGNIATPMHADADTAALAAMHPLGRMGAIGDIVEGVRYPGGRYLCDRGDPAHRRRPERRTLSLNLAPPPGLEPGTYRLTAERSAN